MEQTKITDERKTKDRENLARIYARAAELSRPGPRPAPAEEMRE